MGNKLRPASPDPDPDPVALVESKRDRLKVRSHPLKALLAHFKQRGNSGENGSEGTERDPVDESSSTRTEGSCLSVEGSKPRKRTWMQKRLRVGLALPGKLVAKIVGKRSGAASSVRDGGSDGRASEERSDEDAVGGEETPVVQLREHGASHPGSHALRHSLLLISEMKEKLLLRQTSRRQSIRCTDTELEVEMNLDDAHAVCEETASLVLVDNEYIMSEETHKVIIGELSELKQQLLDLQLHLNQL